jgi:hypothetical protein
MVAFHRLPGPVSPRRSDRHIGMTANGPPQARGGRIRDRRPRRNGEEEEEEE